LKIEAFPMSSPRTIRMTRVRRAAAITTAAVAVVLGPTACDSASAGGSGAYGAGHTGHDVVDVVPVANKDRAEEDGSGREGATDGRDREGGDRNGRDREGREDRDRNGNDEDVAEPEAEVADGGEELQAADNGDEGDAARQENNGLDVLGRDCEASDLPPHTGFQDGNRCSDTAFGEVGSEKNNPSLLITESPETVKVNEPFQIKVKTRNLVRDRFLGAADGGYYLESSFLNEDGLQRGHFHTACRVIDAEPPSPDPVPEFFLATQDNKGGAEADEVVIEVPGIDTAGEIQCASWAGDGSHRIPMMQRANQTPAFDAVRITVEE
jgi:hypothetical protein